jgi:hypothetical protein
LRSGRRLLLQYAGKKTIKEVKSMKQPSSIFN